MHYKLDIFYLIFKFFKNPLKIKSSIFWGVQDILFSKSENWWLVYLKKIFPNSFPEFDLRDWFVNKSTISTTVAKSVELLF